MKQWTQKLVQQLDYEFKEGSPIESIEQIEMSEERATLISIIDTLSKHVLDSTLHPVRQTREILDAFARDLVNPNEIELEKTLFRFRQFFSVYCANETTYVRNSFEEFKGILWDLVDQLADDVRGERIEDENFGTTITQLKDAVEADAMDGLKTRAREFVDFYVEHQSRKNTRKERRMVGIKKNLDGVKRQLEEANRSMRLDHLTSAYNRKSFDEKLIQERQLCEFSGLPATVLILDIDHFKKVNDTYGHDTGDFVIKECVRMIKQSFDESADFVARIGGEEFAVVLPNHNAAQAAERTQEMVDLIRNLTLNYGGMKIRFTVSVGIAELIGGESAEAWLKRADDALYNSKSSGRDRFSISDSNRMTRAA